MKWVLGLSRLSTAPLEPRGASPEPVLKSYAEKQIEHMSENNNFCTQSDNLRGVKSWEMFLTFCHSATQLLACRVPRAKEGASAEAVRWWVHCLRKLKCTKSVLISCALCIFLRSCGFDLALSARNYRKCGAKHVVTLLCLTAVNANKSCIKKVMTEVSRQVISSGGTTVDFQVLEQSVPTIVLSLGVLKEHGQTLASLSAWSYDDQIPNMAT